MNSRTYLSASIAALLAISLTGCGTLSEKTVSAELPDAQKGPKEEPIKNITNFSDALRCMDNTFVEYKIKGERILVEDLNDSTSEVKAGTKDMLISAISDMNRRSRAIELIAYGNDSGNLVSFLNSAGRQSHFADVPKYDIRGSISQMDKDVIKHQADAGLSFEEAGGGIGGSAGASILGLDLSVLDTSTMAVIPGVNSRNSVVVMSSGTGFGGDAAIRKAGVSFSFSFAKSEGKGQALRNLVELASIELIGKLYKMPYWSCLGIDPETPEIAAEIEDWYFAMEANNELVRYLETQLKNRGYYPHPIAGTTTPQLVQAVNRYRSDLGMAKNNDIDIDFFKAFLNKSAPKPQAVAATEVINNDITSSGDISITPKSGNKSFLPGQEVKLSIAAKKDTYLYCYYRDDKNQIIRFFPNRFKQEAYLEAGKSIEIPGEMPFKITASDRGLSETIACFGTPTHVQNNLPLLLRNKDFEPMRAKTLEEIKNGYQKASQTLAESYYSIETAKGVAGAE